jgi:hypothetical protein
LEYIPMVRRLIILAGTAAGRIVRQEGHPKEKGKKHEDPKGS